MTGRERKSAKGTKKKIRNEEKNGGQEKRLEERRKMSIAVEKSPICDVYDKSVRPVAPTKQK